MYKLIIIALLSSTLLGCATKHYGRAPVVTASESAQLDCTTVNIEIAKTHGFIEHVNQESQFDGRSVLSFLGDFGIGNILEKDAAMESAESRLADLEKVRNQKDCALASR